LKRIRAEGLENICPKYLARKLVCNKINKVNNTLLFCLDTPLYSGAGAKEAKKVKPNKNWLKFASFRYQKNNSFPTSSGIQTNFLVTLIQQIF